MSRLDTTAVVKVCVLSTVHRSHDVRICKQAETLAKDGYEVALVIPDADDGSARQRLAERGIRLIALPLPRGRLERIGLTSLHALRALLKESPDIVQFHDPELLPLGLVLQRLGFRVVYDIHEYVSEDILTKEYLPKGLRRPASQAYGSLERAVAHLLDGICVATEGLEEELARVGPVLIRNFPPLDEFGVGDDPMVPFEERRQLTYVGGISKARGVLEMIQALDFVPDLRLALGGSFPEGPLLEEARSLQAWGRVDRIGYLSRDAMRSLFSQSFCGLILFQPGPNHSRSQPNKLYEYMAAGIPLVASDFPSWRKLIDGYRVGVCVDPSDPKAIGEAINSLRRSGEAEAMGRRARAAFEEHFCWEREAPKLLELFSRLSPETTGENRPSG